MRLFVGIWPPPDVTAVVGALPRPEVPSVRWTEPEQWHVTLRFLGEVGEEEVPDLHAALGGVAGHQRPAPVELGPATTRLGPQVLVVPAAGLDGLAAAVTEATAGFGEPPDPRPFRGHLTLARGRGRRPVPFRLAGRPLAGAWSADELCLVRSLLGSRGATYETVATFRLAGQSSDAGG